MTRFTLLLLCFALWGAAKAASPQTWVVRLASADQASVEAFALQHSLHVVGSLPHLPGYVAFQTTAGTPRHFGPQLVHQAGSEVEWMEQQRDHKRYTRSGSYTVNDPQWSHDWHLKHGPAGVRAVEAWVDRRVSGTPDITVAIVDDGLQSNHPDLRGQFNAHDSWDYNYNRPSVQPSSRDGHGTSAAGVCCATRNNHKCGTGVCPGCRVAGIRLIAGPTSDYTEARALAHHDLPIYSCSWGPADSGDHMEAPGHLLKETLAHQCAHGRGGKGTIYVWAGGNGRRNQDNGNYDGYANDKHTLAIGALNDGGHHSYYSEPCACLHAVAPSSGSGHHRGISTTDLMGRSGYSAGDCTNRFGGTSSAAPLAAGIVGLMLQHRPDLRWRDVQHVIAKGATRVQPHDAGWSHNARGYRHHHDYGFGNLVLGKLLDAAKDHQLVPAAQKQCTTGRRNAHAALPYSGRVTFGSCTLSFVEHVEVQVSWAHARHGQVVVALESPEHITSELANPRGDTHGGNKAWTFGSVRHWGERITHGATWTLRVTDSAPHDAHSGHVLWYTVTVYGY